MKKIKSLIALVILLIGIKSSSAQINGSPYVVPGYNYTYTISAFSVYNGTWTIGAGGSIVSQSAYQVTIKVLPTNTACHIILTVTGTLPPPSTAAASAQLSLSVDPFIKGPAVVYPGELVSYTAFTPCDVSCVNYSWSATIPGCTSCGINSSVISVLPPVTNPPASFNVSCNLNCLFGSGYNGGTPNYPVTVRLRTPAITFTPTYCYDPITFTASLVNGATSYSWTYPSGWTLVSQTTNTITLTPNGTGGTVTVTAKYGTTLSSDPGSIAVTLGKDESRHNLIALPNSDVFYIGTDQKIHRMYWTTLWNYDHIVPSGGWGTVNVEGWLTKSVDNQSVYFKSRDNKLYELSYPATVGAAWTLQQITAAAVDVKGNIACREDGIFYIGTDDNIHRVYKTGATWNYQALLPYNWQGITIQGNLALAPYPYTNIYFRTTSGRLYNLYGDYNSIAQGEIPTSSGCSGDIVVDPVTGRIYFKSSDKIHYAEWTTPAGWVETAISASNVNYTVNGYIVLAYYKIFFKGTDGKLHNLYQSGTSWLEYPLSNTLAGVAGDIVAMDGKIIYVNNSDNKVHQYSWLPTNGPWYDEPFTSFNVKTCTNQYTLLTKSMSLYEEEQADGIEEAGDKEPVSIYPNPSKGAFTIALGSGSAAEISVFDMLGNKIKTYSNSGRELLNVDLSSFPRGIYLINIVQDNKLISKKVVLQ